MPECRLPRSDDSAIVRFCPSRHTPGDETRGGERREGGLGWNSNFKVFSKFWTSEFEVKRVTGGHQDLGSLITKISGHWSSRSIGSPGMHYSPQSGRSLSRLGMSSKYYKNHLKERAALGYRRRLRGCTSALWRYSWSGTEFDSPSRTGWSGWKSERRLGFILNSNAWNRN